MERAQGGASNGLLLGLANLNTGPLEGQALAPMRGMVRFGRVRVAFGISACL